MNHPHHEQKPYEPLPSMVLPRDVGLSLMSEDQLKKLQHYMAACIAYRAAKYGEERDAPQESEGK